MKSYTLFFLIIGGCFELYGAQQEVTLNSLFDEAESSEDFDFVQVDDDPDPDMDSFFGFNLNDEAEQDAADAEGKPDFLGGLFSQFVAQEGEEPSQFGALSTEQLLRVAMGYVPSVVRPHVKKLGALGTDLGKKAVDLGTQTGIIEGPIAAYLKENINEANLVFTEGGLSKGY